MKVITKFFKRKASDVLFDISLYVIACLIILLVIYPLWFVFIASFSDPSSVARGDVLLWPKEWSLNAYRTLLQDRSIWIGYRNTILYTFFGILFGLAVNLPAGYALSRQELLGKKVIQFLFLVPMFISGGLIPTYLVVRDVGLLNNPLVMIVPFAVSSYNVIVAKTFFKSNIPEGLWEAAQMDGAGTIRFFFSFVLPLSKAIIAVIGLWTAVGIWNSWFNALIYLTDADLQPLQLVLRRILVTNDSLLKQATGSLASKLRDLSEMMKYAAIVVSTLPILCLYPLLQKHFNKGVMIGSIKE
ncbi:carbohydrate ABC transporter permease [Streptococcus ictaluri]|uniref:ABC transporter, permease protein n=1 Tax=Streptococcus ictaluri 707-05 TaxID=764299 RepID=G5JZU2_9STRE|nr:carbohydrate ABC transporter permease [Streptococcus ictaluri]EHI70885.1 ABC transporter, permease protein [Streptococcus ictaluri 707-05]